MQSMQLIIQFFNLTNEDKFVREIGAHSTGAR